jgi:hypothetical protein
MKGCVYGTSISWSISHCMQSYSFASMMLSRALHYQCRLKGRVTHVLFHSHTFQEAINFFKYLPYWKDLQTCHIIDLMHVTKNIFDSIIGTLLDVPRKSKDGLKSRTDLVQFQLRLELHRISRHNGKYFLP